MYCSKCNTENRDDAKFCSECGTSLEAKDESRKCSNCGADLDETYGFCPECGTSTDGSISVMRTQGDDLTIRFCRECGSELKEGAAFCDKCGASIETISHMPSGETSNGNNEENISMGVENFNTIDAIDDEQENSLERKKKQMLIAGIGIVVLCIAVVWFIKRPKKTEYEPPIVQEETEQDQFEQEEVIDSESSADIDLDGAERIQDLVGTLVNRDGESYLVLPEEVSLIAYEVSTNIEYYLQDVREIRLVEKATGDPAFMDMVEGTEISVNGNLVIEEGLPVIYEDTYVSEKYEENSIDEENIMNEDITGQSEVLGGTPEEGGITGIKAQETKHIEEVAVQSAELETVIAEATTQTEWNEYSTQLYSLWDDELNRLWGVLKKHLDSVTMDQLLQEQREWIKEKEDAMETEGNLVVGGSTETLNRNMEGVSFTRYRVYELLEYLPE